MLGDTPGASRSDRALDEDSSRKSPGTSSDSAEGQPTQRPAVKVSTALAMSGAATAR